MQVKVTTSSLEQRSRADIVSAPEPDLRPLLMRAVLPSPELGRFLYTAVGGNWYWIDRLGWSYERWLEWQRRPGVETWVAYVQGTPAGYFELDGSSGGAVEIAYFGLLPAWVGRGIGGWLLTKALERAWDLEPERVWVHTCTLDGPYALANYKARGMRVFAEETHVEELGEEPEGPWPGAGPHGPHAVLEG